MAEEPPPWLEDVVKYSMAAFLVIVGILLLLTLLGAF